MDEASPPPGGPAAGKQPYFAPIQKPALGLAPRTASTLCYAVGWLTGIFFLLLERNDKDVRYHAWHSIVVSLPLMFITGALLILALLLNSVAVLGVLLLLLWFAFVGGCGVLWAWLLYTTYRGEESRLPVTPEIARKLNERGGA